MNWLARYRTAAWAAVRRICVMVRFLRNSRRWGRPRPAPCGHYRLHVGGERRHRLGVAGLAGEPPPGGLGENGTPNREPAYQLERCCRLKRRGEACRIRSQAQDENTPAPGV